MKLKLFKTLLLLSVLLIASSFRHPIKLTASLIEYNPETNKISLECRVFIDDFKYSINKQDFNESNLTKEDKEVIESFFNEFYTIKINDKILTHTYKSSEVIEGYNIFIIRFEETDITIKKGDNILVENKLFFEQFKDFQKNRVTIRVPPFFKQKNYETKRINYSISLDF